MQNVPLMPEKMEQTSIQDFKVQEELETDSKAEFDQEHKFLDVLVKYLVDKEVKMVLAKMIGLAHEESNKGGHNMEFQEPQTGQNVQINKIQFHDEEELLDEVIPPPIITIQIGNEQKLVQALIDIGSDCNTISKDLFDQLEGIGLLPTNAILRLFIAYTTIPRGICNLVVYVDDLSCRDKFFVTHLDLQDVLVILGRTWQKRCNCFFNWKNNLVHCQISNNQLWVPLQRPD